MRIVILLLGLIFGSLGSVVMTRFADGITWKKLRGFFFGYSECPQCKHRLHAGNLFPVVSYLVQGGKCNYCGKKISRIYPVLECLCVGIFLLTYVLLKNFGTPILVFGLLTNRLLILLLVYDLQTYELHIIVRILLVIVGILANVLAPGGNIRYAFLSVLLFGGVFTGIYFFGKRYAKIRFKQAEGFGQGDVYLSGAIGLFIPLILNVSGIVFSGWMFVNVLILFILMSSIIGLLRAGLQYVLNGKLKIENGKLKIVPFLPAMILVFRILAWKAPYFISLVFPLAG